MCWDEEKSLKGKVVIVRTVTLHVPVVPMRRLGLWWVTVFVLDKEKNVGVVSAGGGNVSKDEHLCYKVNDVEEVLKLADCMFCIRVS